MYSSISVEVGKPDKVVLIHEAEQIIFFSSFCFFWGGDGEK